MEPAIGQLQSGDCKQAVTEAHKSVESTMKAVLGISGHVTFGSLPAQLLKSGLVPDYYEEFLRHFEKVALGAVKERNLPGRGHGQGATPQAVSRALADDVRSRCLRILSTTGGSVRNEITRIWCPHSQGCRYLFQYS